MRCSRLRRRYYTTNKYHVVHIKNNVKIRCYCRERAWPFPPVTYTYHVIFNRCATEWDKPHSLQRCADCLGILQTWCCTWTHQNGGSRAPALRCADCLGILRTLRYFSPFCITQDESQPLHKKVPRTYSIFLSHFIVKTENGREWQKRHIMLRKYIYLR